jgi:hypothetical protein
MGFTQRWDTARSKCPKDMLSRASGAVHRNEKAPPERRGESFWLKAPLKLVPISPYLARVVPSPETKKPRNRARLVKIWKTEHLRR